MSGGIDKAGLWQNSRAMVEVHVVLVAWRWGHGFKRKLCDKSREALMTREFHQPERQNRQVCQTDDDIRESLMTHSKSCLCGRLA